MHKTGLDLASWVITGLTLAGLVASSGVPGGRALAAAGDTLVVTGDGVNVRFGPSAEARVKMRVYHDQEVLELQREGEWVRAEIAGSGGQDGWIHGSLLAAPGGAARAAPGAAASRPEAVEPPTPPPPANRPAAVPKASTAAAPPSPAAAAVTAPQVGQGPADGSRIAARAAPPPGPDPRTIEPAAAPAAEAQDTELARFRQSVEYLNSRAVSVAGVDLFTTVEPAGAGVVQVAATEAWSTIPPAGQQSYANTLLDRWAAARGAGGPVSVQIVDPEGAVLLERSRP
jgi:hypothetical protein